MSDLLCAVIERGLDGLDQLVEVEAPLLELRAEVRAQLGFVRADEPGAVKRLQALLHLLLEAEFRQMLR